MAATEFFSTPLLQNSSLKSYYRFEGNSNDSKGTNNGTDSTISYNASYGKFGQGASFNGSSSRIVLPDGADFKPTSGAYSFGCWFNKQTADGNVFQSYSDSGGNPKGIEISVSTGYTITHANNPTLDQLSATGTPFTDSQWNLIIVTYNGTTLKAYANGVLNNSGNKANPGYSATNYVEIGRRNNGASQTNYFGGYIDDWFFFNGYEMTQTDVTNYYTGNWGGGFFLNLL